MQFFFLILSPGQLDLLNSFIIMCILYNSSSGDNNFMNLLKSTNMLGIFGYINEIECVHFLFNIKARFKQYRLF